MAGRRRNVSARGAGPAPTGSPEAPWPGADPAPLPPPPAVAEAPQGRPWSPAAALEPLDPPAPPRRAARAGRLRGGAGGGRSWVTTAAVGVAIAVALAVAVTARLRPAGTAPPPSPPPAALVLGRLAAASDGVPAGLLTAHFPASAPQVDVGCDYSGASPGEVIEFRITVQPAASGVVPPVLPAQRHTFGPGDGRSGHITVSVAGGTQGLVPGVYTVAAVLDGRLVRTTAFTVDAPAPAPTPTPAPRPTLAAPRDRGPDTSAPSPDAARRGGGHGGGDAGGDGERKRE